MMLIFVVNWRATCCGPFSHIEPFSHFASSKGTIYGDALLGFPPSSHRDPLGYLFYCSPLQMPGPMSERRDRNLKERRFSGKKMPRGAKSDMPARLAIQAESFKAWSTLIKWPFERIGEEVPLIEIGPDELGVIEAMMVSPCHQARISRLIALRCS